MGFFNKIKEGLSKTRKAMATTLGSVFSGFSNLDDEFYDELEESLILADLGVETAGKAVAALRKRAKENRLKEPEEARQALKDILVEMLTVGDTALNLGTKPSVILVIGVNGVGKTTSAVNLAAAMGRAGKRVLLVDADPQGNATSGLGISKRRAGGTVYDLLIGRLKADEAVVRTDFKNLSVIPSSMDLVGAELELVDEERRQYRLRDALRPLREQYDVIAVDCPPSLGLLTINALTAADGVVVPLLCEYYSLEGLSQLTQTIRQIKKLYNPSLELLGVLINMYDGRLNLTVQVMDEIKRHFADKLFRVPIPRNVKVSEAPSFGQPIRVMWSFIKCS